MHDFWLFLSAVGESRLVLPAAFVAMLCMVSSDLPAAAQWLGTFSAACMLVLASKVAFLGWGYGWAAIDFTGFSGHAMVSSAIYPVLGYAVGNTYSARSARWLAAGGLVLAVLIAVSRVVLSAHSPSETVLGLLIGTAVSGLVLMRWPAGRVGVRFAVVALGFVLSWVASMAVVPQVRTHNVVVALALALSGEEVPYTREALHREAGRR